MDALFNIVFVCTGNRFRSPIAAAVFAAATAGQPVGVHSVGTVESAGAPALPEAVRACSSLGLDLSSHRSSTLGRCSLRDADLVVGFEPAHVARAVVEAGARAERSFLLEDLVAALEGSAPLLVGNGVERARAAVALAVERRAGRRSSISIPDPFGGPPLGYESTATRIRDLSGRLAALLFEDDRG